MDFVKVLLGKRLLEDEIARGLDAATSLPSVKRRHAEAAVRDAVKALEPDGITWRSAGSVELTGDGKLSPPRLPHSAGVVRVDTVGPGIADYAIGLTEHASMASEEDTWVATPELKGQMLAGVRFDIFYLEAADHSTGTLTLTEHEDRRTLIRSIEVSAEGSGYWLAYPIDGRNVLILK